MNELQQFFSHVLEASGAAVEVVEPEGLEVLAPPSVQEVLGLPEWARLGFGSDLPDQGERVTLESPLVERVPALLGERGRRSCLLLAPHNPPLANPERVLQQVLDVRNATYRLVSVSAASASCEILTFRYTAISDEKREGLLYFGLNRNTGATLDELLLDLLTAAETLPPQPLSHAVSSPPLPWGHAQFIAILERALPPRLHRHLESFFAGMSRRQGRDLQRLLAYHQDLQREAAARLAALQARGEPSERQQAEQTRERQRMEAIAREYEAKVADLRQKYAVKVDLAWLQSLELMTPVQRLTLRFQRRKQERIFTLDWHPLARKLEQLPCEYSYTAERPRELCDEALHFISPEAHGPCPACQKPFCRACHPDRCPKCGRPVG